jgi:hypothetical protein
MKRTIISHDDQTAIAVVRFEHNGVTYEDKFDLGMTIPGARQVFEQLGMPFDKDAQLRSLDQLTARVQNLIELGAIENKPTPPDHPEAKI